MKTMLKRTLFAAVAMVGTVLAAPLYAQGTAPATVHGHVNDAAGSPLANVQVKFSTDKTADAKDRKYQYTVDTDANGDYKATNVAPGDYVVIVFKGTVQADYQLLTVKAGDDKTLNFDMTREEYLKSLSPEVRAQIEEVKKKNAAANSANAVIARLNATLKTVRADLAAAAPTKADVSADVTSMKQAVDAKADVGLLWITYGDTLLAQGDHLAAADKAAGKPAMSDDEVLKTYSDAADAYKKGAELDLAGSKPTPGDAAVAYSQMGTALARSGKVAEATAAFDDAAKTDPAKAGLAYNNEAIILYQAGQADAAGAAADKAIAADPTRPIPYYIKGQSLIQKATMDPKTNKIIAPPGCVAAYEKFLDLAPNDPHAPEVREVLAGFDEKIDTKYKATKK